MFNFIFDIGNYEQRKVDNTQIGGFKVDTAYTSDEGYETAILDANGVHPVERYKDREAAQRGHLKWAIAMGEGLREVTKLGGLGGWVPDEPIILVPEEAPDANN